MADGTIVREVYLGGFAAPPCSAEQTTVVSDLGLGLWAGRQEAGLGLRHARYACVARDCQVVFWPETAVDVADLLRAFDQFKDICVIK